MPQPIDFHTEMAKVTAAERVQEVLARVSLAAQQRQTAMEQQTRVETETQVIQTKETENPAIDREGKRRNPFVGRRRRRTGLTQENQDMREVDSQPTLPGSQHVDEGHKFDMTV